MESFKRISQTPADFFVAWPPPPTPPPPPLVPSPQVKERLISQGAWPGSGGPRVNTEEQDFKVGGGLASVLLCGYGAAGMHGQRA
jgi:hypothetical protein